MKDHDFIYTHKSIYEQKQNSTAHFVMLIFGGVSFQPNNNNFIDFNRYTQMYLRISEGSE